MLAASFNFYIWRNKNRQNMKNFLLACAVLISSASFAQINAPQPSPTATISQKVGLSDVEITYSRPGKKDRQVFGELVAFDQEWRLGANRSTKITFSDDVTILGNEIPAGQYALYAIPRENEWEIIVHKDLTQNAPGAYEESEELVRFVVETHQLKDTWESFTIDFTNFTSTGAHLFIAWENTAVHIPIVTKTDEMMEKQIKQVLVDGPSASSYASGARYYLDQKKDMKQALAWMTKACDMRPEAFWYLYNKAQIQAELGLKKEAIATATKSMEMAKANEGGDYGYVMNNEKLIAEIKAKK
jgi:tetratricopeptide (TPR) repeat protein